ncbi:MAG: ribonuclease III domain-containing protein [Candidatus Gastranaerophilaceae bacterium]
MEEMHLRNYAYLGDAVWELFIREKTVKLTDNSKKLHEITTSKVKMGFQAELLRELDSVLTEEEQEISRRGRNLQIPIGRRQNQGEYRLATAFETLIGWWYLNNPEKLKEVYKITEKYIKF